MRKLFLLLVFLTISFSVFSLDNTDYIDDLFDVPDETYDESIDTNDNIPAMDSYEDISLDSLFEEPDETVDDASQNKDATEEPLKDSESDEDARINIADLTKNDKPLVKGTLSADGAIALGFTEWPSALNETVFSDLAADFDASPYYTMKPVFTIDVRPKSYFRLYTALYTSLNQNDLTFSSPSFSELFIDYTYKETYFFRIGKQSLTWGQGLLLSNIGNFVSDVPSSVSIKSFIPIGANGLTTLIYTDTITSPLDFSYAALFETTIGPLTSGISAKLNRTLEQELITDLYLKTVIGEVDVALEGRFDFDLGLSSNTYLWPTSRSLINFFWENSSVQLLGEYMFAIGPKVTVNTGWDEENDVSTQWAEYGQHRLGLGAIAKKAMIGKFKPGIRWYHNFIDNSGQFVLGLTGPFAPMITANIALPVTYGPDYGYYSLSNEDPENRVLSLIIELELSSSFSF